MIREIENPHILDLLGYVPDRHIPQLEDRDFLQGISLTGSGKGSLALILKYLQKKDVLTNKLSEVMVPDWVGYWVYNQIQPFAFPVKKVTEKTKALIVYHQYGFPQDLDPILEYADDKNLIVIEDCAHAIDSYYKGRKLGTIGDFALYSYSKWFFCFALGGVSSRDKDFDNFVMESLKNTPFGISTIKNTTKLLSEVSLNTTNHNFQKIAGTLLNMSYSVYGDALKPTTLAKRLLKKKIASEIYLRRQRYQYFINEVKNLGICEHLELDNITPYIIPIICPPGYESAILGLLRDMDVVTGEYQFDVNRNLLNPHFKKCIWVPCHSGISDQIFYSMTSAIKKKLALVL